jgi:sterol desaturase/sphingolipid hydroxylase (fatty acid hydroxylase superfamily)
LFGYLGSRQPGRWPIALVSFMVGVAAYTLAEYSIHRWLLHNPRSLFFPLHAFHHSNPRKPAGLPFVTTPVTLLPIWLLLTKMHFEPASLLLCGLSAGYFYFGVLHHVEHSTRIRQIPFRWLQQRWAAHSVHHRLDQTNFGVTTSLWDYVFGTEQKRRALPS